MHPLEASRALKRVSVHIQVADGAGVPGVRMVADGAGVKMDITTNKEQCQDKETPKGGPINKKKRSRPVVTGQRAARRKNSPRQWGRPFGRAPQEICPAISTHPHWVGACTTTMRWQDVGAAFTLVAPQTATSKSLVHFKNQNIWSLQKMFSRIVSRRYH